MSAKRLKRKEKVIELMSTVCSIERLSKTLFCLLKVSFLHHPSLHHSSLPSNKNFSQKMKDLGSPGDMLMTTQRRLEGSDSVKSHQQRPLSSQLQFSLFLPNTILKSDHRHSTFQFPCFSFVLVIISSLQQIISSLILLHKTCHVLEKIVKKGGKTPQQNKSDLLTSVHFKKDLHWKQQKSIH